MSVREDLNAEIVRRLVSVVDPTGTVVVLDGSAKVDQDTMPLPVIYTYEDDETVVQPKPGLYRKNLPYVFEYFRVCDTSRDTQPLGRKMLDAFTTALELDERIQIGGPTDPPNTEQELVAEYGMTSNAIIELQEDRVLLSVSYEFIYFDRFKGYQANRR